MTPMPIVDNVVVPTRAKHTARRVGPLLALSGLVAFGACICEPPPSPPPDAGPGNRCAVDLLYNADTAETVTLGAQVDGLLCPALDADWYRFSVAAPGSVVRVHLWMDTHLTPVEPGYSLMRGDGTPIGISNRHPNRSAGEPVDFEGSHRLEEAGDYVVVIQDVEGFEDRLDITNAYHVTVEVVADPDENERNNTADEATAITAGSSVTGLIATTGDEDWYALPVEDDARIIDVTARASRDIGVDLMLEVRAPDGMTALGSHRLRDVDGELMARSRIGAAGAPGSVFYLRVFDESGDKAQIDEQLGTYELAVEVIADPDAQEVGGRNDSIDTATVTTSLPATYTGTLSAMNDQDFFEVTPPGNTSVANPGVLVVTVTASGGVPDVVQPQVLVFGHDPERATGDLEACPCEQDIDPNNPVPNEPPQFCLPQSATASACGEVRYQQVLSDRLSWTFGYPLRNARPVLVSVNDFGDDEFQETGDYTVELSILDDPDPGEVGDDYLIPNLQFPTYDNSDEIWTQRNESRPRARDISAPFLPLCSEVVEGADGGVADGGDDGGTVVAPTQPCMEEANVPNPSGGQVGSYVVCDGQDWTVQGSGRLTYQGDRDWFRVEVPAAGYWALDFAYSVNVPTPVELTFFVYGEDDLISAWLDADETGSGCQSTFDCPLGSLCVDGKCWADIDDNPSFVGHTFPNVEQCSYLHVNDDRPLYIEVTDNGINDFDPDMTYSFEMRVRCGCPEVCNGGFNSCQGVAPPQ